MHGYDYGLILAFFALVLIPAPFLGRFYYRAVSYTHLTLPTIYSV